ncbi:MAG: AAA family ATPase [Candidatus Parcubacteria bacterium]|nr:AAA family ATPase [Candidatus Parcubacteria bacterium]
MEENKKKFIRLDEKRRGELSDAFIAFASERIIGQPRIIKTFAKMIERDNAGFRCRTKPASSVFIAGPSGVGKTEAVKVLAEFLFGNLGAFTRIDCQEFSEAHGVAGLKGSPPGYLGYGDEPRITQEKLDSWGYKKILKEFFASLDVQQRAKIEELEQEFLRLTNTIKGLKSRKVAESSVERLRLTELRNELRKSGYPMFDKSGKTKYSSVFLFDELERADNSFYNMLYTILDEAYLPIVAYNDSEGNSIERIQFHNTFLFATSNTGHEGVRELLNINSGRSTGMKFCGSSVVENTDEEIYESCKKDVNRTFETSFLGRFDHFLVARPLYLPEIRRIVDLQIAQLAVSLEKEWGCPLELDIDEPSREFIASESNDDPTKGARLVQKKIKNLLLDPLTSLRATRQIFPGDHLQINLETKDDRRHLTFSREESKGLIVFSAAV